MGRNAIDMVGMKFGRLKILRREGSNKHGKALWLCACDCGNTSIAEGVSIRKGVTRSCGCLAKPHGEYLSSEYRTWADMKNRCLNTSIKHYKDYGGRGITVCDRWKNSFKNFIDDMGHKPKEGRYSIERIDNSGNYEPSNCKWADDLEQKQNTRKNKWFYAISPIGRRYKARGQRLFSRAHGLDCSAVCRVLKNKISNHKGWVFYYA